MGDYISREDVKQLVRDDNEKHGYSERFHNFSIKLWNLPSADVRENRWIPVSERLPEKNVWVLVTVEQSGKRYQEIMRRNNYTEAWTDDIDNYTDEITAWQPLPEPYKAENHETCKGCIEPCIMYEPDMRACKHKVTERGE